MTQTKFSLSWGAHKTNLSTGFSLLQQNGEFVDMTLAADGHHVKVHQVIMALASPYIKELIASAQCPHPIIFLNKISSNTLSAILEYIYTGEVQVAVENLTELFEAGRELHIKGLEDMRKIAKSDTQQSEMEITRESEDVGDPNSEYCYFEVTDADDDIKYTLYESASTTQTIENVTEHQIVETLDEQTFNEQMQTQEDNMSNVLKQEVKNVMDNNEMKMVLKNPKVIKSEAYKKVSGSDINIMQYTVSNQGNLQLILNRFVYYLKHTKRDGTRHWRCVDYLGPSRCPATLVTNDEVVLQRMKVHTHMFHDKKILKKVQAGAIFSAIQDAIREGENKKTVTGDQNILQDLGQINSQVRPE